MKEPNIEELKQELEELKQQQREAEKSKLQIIFYLLTALNSAGYIAYVLVFYNLVIQATGAEGALWALSILAGSLLLEALFEIPTGIVGDLYGHRKSVFFSFVALAFHSIFYLGAVFLLTPGGINYGTITLIIFAEIMLALGTALNTGSLNSWFVINIKQLGFNDEPLHVFMGRRRLVTNVVWLIVGVFILLLQQNDSTRQDYSGFIIAFTIGVISYLSGAILTYRLTKSSVSGKNKDAETMPFNKYIWEEFNGAISEITKNRKLLVITITHAVFWTLAVMVTYFWQEIFHITTETDKTYMTLKYAVVWLFIAFGRIIGSHFAERIKVGSYEKGDKRASRFIMGQILLSLPILFIFSFEHMEWFTILLGALLLAISRIGQEYSKPISMAWTHEEVKNNKFRATTESLIEGAAGFVIVILVAPVIYFKEEMKNLARANDYIEMVVIILAWTVLVFNIPLTWLIIYKNVRSKKES